MEWNGKETWKYRRQQDTNTRNGVKWESIILKVWTRNKRIRQNIFSSVQSRSLINNQRQQQQQWPIDSRGIKSISNKVYEKPNAIICMNQTEWNESKGYNVNVIWSGEEKRWKKKYLHSQDDMRTSNKPGHSRAHSLTHLHSFESDFLHPNVYLPRFFPFVQTLFFRQRVSILVFVRIFLVVVAGCQ